MNVGTGTEWSVFAASSQVPIVLDESIYNEADIVRAARIGAYGVKLKLMKNFGIAETLSLARQARHLGLIVVFGNGVATDIGNLGEYLVIVGRRRDVRPAGRMQRICQAPQAVAWIVADDRRERSDDLFWLDGKEVANRLASSLRLSG